MQDITPTSQIEVVSQVPGENQIEQAINHYDLLTQYVSRILKEGIDYGTIPRGQKPILFKSGAEKLLQLFKLRAEFVLVKSVEDWTGEQHGLKEPLFHYSYRCILYYPKINGQPVGEGSGSCNSLESKYRGSNWRYDLVNTLAKMAQKRAMVAATLIATGASGYFDQDLEDWQNIVNGTQEDPNAKEIAIAKVGELIKELGWSIEQAQSYLKQNYGVSGRKQLSLRQLNELIERLSQIKTKT